MASPGKILVIGSSNTDLVVSTTRFPHPGETVLGNDFFMHPGGKGANQAVAAARLGAKVTFIAKMGDDLFGQAALASLSKEGIDISAVGKDSEMPSGIALIAVNPQAENTIIVAPGANMHLTAADIDNRERLIRSSDLILVQLEIPMQTVEHIVGLARKHQKRIILNPAPAQRLSDALLKALFLITPNQTEAALLTGVDPKAAGAPREMATKLLERGVQNVIITLGENGAWFSSPHQELQVPAPKVQPVDSTGAGDVFNGALAHFLADGVLMPQALSQACRAASFSVTKMGAQTSAPTKADLLEFP